MESILSILLLIALGAVLVVLAFGIGVFVRGGEFNRRHANRLMNLRVATQAVVVVILGLILLLKAL
jgi:hypothetical protein